MERLYLVDGVRTGIGVPHKSLQKTSLADMSAPLIRALLERSKLDGAMVDEVIFGSTVVAGSGQNFARVASLRAGIPASVPAWRVANVCGTGLQAVIAAARSIAAGDGECIIAGGAEAVSLVPNFVKRDDDIPLADKHETDGLVNDGLWCQSTDAHMGQICEAMAGEEGISREDQDAYALQGYLKCRRAVDEGCFSGEIIALQVTPKKTFARDEHVRHNITKNNFEGLHPVFSDNGTITAGTASAPCDGAAAVMVASRRFSRRHKLRPLARIAGYTVIGVEPQDTFRAAVPAAKNCLKQCGWSLKDVDLFEICEAFAAQAIYTQRALQIPHDKLNIFGGDLILGHPLGAAGARVLVTLMHALKSRNKRKGLAVVCLGGGGAVAVAVEKAGSKD